MNIGILITLGTIFTLGLVIVVVVVLATRGNSTETVTTTTAEVETRITNQIEGFQQNMQRDELVASTGLKVLCFFVPLVGLLIYACNISFNRKFATECGKWSLISFLILVGMLILVFGIAIIMTIINMSTLLIV